MSVAVRGLRYAPPTDMDNKMFIQRLTRAAFSSFCGVACVRLATVEAVCDVMAVPPSQPTSRPQTLLISLWLKLTAQFSGLSSFVQFSAEV